MVGREIGPYRILQKLAQGTMCSVYKGIHTGLEQEVAIKFLLPEYFEDKTFRDRFIREAKIQAKLSHPNIVKTLNLIQDDHEALMVMEYVNGETLDVLLKKTGALPPERARAILESALEAIDFMHSKGIVHRDIKPANIMVSYDGFVKVMDFGIAKVLGENGKTKTGIRMGTLWYMSPEQIKGEPATILSDIYSLGITFYQMVTGTVPFDGETEFEIMKRHIEKEPTAPCKINKDLDKMISNVILRAMAKNPKGRYQSVRAFLTDIRNTVNPQDITKTFVQEPASHGPLNGYFRGLSRSGKAFFVVATLFIIGGAAVFAFYSSSDNTTWTNGSRDVNVNIPAAVKPEAKAAADIARIPKKTITPLQSDIPESDTRPAIVKSNVHKTNLKMAGSSARRSKNRSTRSHKKVASAASMEHSSQGSGITKPEPVKESATPKKTTDRNVETWSIRK
jgi:serine/threonine protein kinase